MSSLHELLRRYQTDPTFRDIVLSDVNQQGLSNNTPLHIACIRGNEPDVDMLLRNGANVNAIGDMGATPLHDAIGQNHIHVVRLLLAAGADLKVVSDFGYTPLEKACERKLHDIIIMIEEEIKRRESKDI
jgi:uncharacterized protein